MCLPVRFNVYGLSHKSDIFEWFTAKKCCSSGVTGDLIIWYSVIIDLHTIVHISHVHPCRFSADNFDVDASNKNRSLFQFGHSLSWIQFSNFFFSIFSGSKRSDSEKRTEQWKNCFALKIYWIVFMEFLGVVAVYFSYVARLSSSLCIFHATILLVGK